MKPGPQRPPTGRTFQVELGGERIQLRRPSFFLATRIQESMKALTHGADLETLGGVAGYAFGCCWWADGRDLDAGRAPASYEAAYGHRVLAELEELPEGGPPASELLQAIQVIATELVAGVNESSQVEETVKNS